MTIQIPIQLTFYIDEQQIQACIRCMLIEGTKPTKYLVLHRCRKAIESEGELAITEPQFDETRRCEKYAALSFENTELYEELERETVEWILKLFKSNIHAQDSI